MKIISNFKDYYDRALAHGSDEEGTRYVRLRGELPRFEVGEDPYNKPGIAVHGKRTKVRKENPKFPFLEKGTDIEFGRDRFFLCGKTYRYIAVKVRPAGWRTIDYETTYCSYDQYEYFYDYEQFRLFVESFGNLVKDIYGETLFGERSHSAKLKDFLSAQGTTEAEAKMIEHRIVLCRKAIREDGRHDRPLGEAYFWETNFPLSEVQFIKLMDPYQVYQELDMYVSGVLGQQAKETINISDKDRIYQHGFDKYSFRKPPEEGRKKKKPI